MSANMIQPAMKYPLGSTCVVINATKCNWDIGTLVKVVGYFTDAKYPYKIQRVIDSGNVYDLVNEEALMLYQPNFNTTESSKTACKPSEQSVGTQVSPDLNKAAVEPSRCLPEPSMQVKSEGINQGIKDDAHKLQWWYMWQFFPELEQVAYVLQQGDIKYPSEDGSNWKRLDKLERRASSAAMRHLSAYLKGDKVDNETNKSHLAHAITNLLFLMYNDRQQST